MKRCLIWAGLVAAMLWGNWSAGAQAQTVVPPTTPNNLTPQQRQKIRYMMRLRRHHRHRHKIPVTPVTPTTSMIATPMLQNPMVTTQFPVRHRGHRHRLLMAQMMMQQMMMNQVIQNQNGIDPPAPSVVRQTPAPVNSGKSVAARRKKLMVAQIQQASF
jgi:hypothetical protein